MNAERLGKPVAWLELTLDCDRESAARLSDFFTEAGALSVTFSNAAEDILIEEAPGTASLWPVTRVHGLFRQGADPERLARALRANGFGKPEVRRIEDQEWSRAWEQHVRPQRYGDRLWVLPSFAEASAPDAVCLRLDPGLAFGTGAHATTALCLEWLAGLALDDKEVIDYGCGSGILAIAAVMLGAKSARCVDNDPEALRSARKNAQNNGVVERVSFHSPGEVPSDPVEVLVANILAGPLIDLAETLSNLLSACGQIALAGILNEQADSVMAAYKHYIAFDTAECRDGWVRLSGTRLPAVDRNQPLVD